MAKPLSIYIHIPFCARKCNYCDFLSAPATRQVQEEYLRALLLEIKYRSPLLQLYKVQTVFIGGGTPSVVESKWIALIMQQIKDYYQVSEDAEISMEMNPGTVDQEALFVYRRAGINRISIGLQSTDNRELKTLGRIHTYEDFLKSYQMAREAGFDNINVDIMSALPGQTLSSYKEGVKKVLKLNPEHISAYSLIIEEGTPFYKLYIEGERSIELPKEDTERAMYEQTKELLAKAGLERYEISNYAKKGKECKHNEVYWQRGDYQGFGLGAASLINETRFSNVSDLKAYISLVESNDLNGLIVEKMELSSKEQMEEFMFLGLRLTKGVRASDFREKFGVSIWEIYGAVLEKNEKDGLLVLGEDIFLTEYGRDVSNYCMAQFLL